MAETEKKAYRWVISGRVQGVGFRYFARRAAESLMLTGWVRNCADGSVEVQVAGTAEALQRFRRELERGPRFSLVEEIVEEDLAQAPRWQSFNIAR